MTLVPETLPRSPRVQELDGAIAVVTGAASGLGTRICHELADAGARVVGVDVREDGLRALVDGRACVNAAHADLTDSSAVEFVLEEIDHDYGRVDLLVNNAGTDTTAPVEDI